MAKLKIPVNYAVQVGLFWECGDIGFTAIFGAITYIPLNLYDPFCVASDLFYMTCLSKQGDVWEGRGVDNAQPFRVYQRERQAILNHSPMCVNICFSLCKSRIYCSVSVYRPFRSPLFSPWILSSLPSLSSCLLRCLKLSDST